MVYTIAISSGKGGKGKTFFSTNLAYFFAKKGNKGKGSRTLLVDCDLEEPDVLDSIKGILETEGPTIDSLVEGMKNQYLGTNGHENIKFEDCILTTKNKNLLAILNNGSYGTANPHENSLSEEIFNSTVNANGEKILGIRQEIFNRIDGTSTVKGKSIDYAIVDLPAGTSFESNGDYLTRADMQVFVVDYSENSRRGALSSMGYSLEGRLRNDMLISKYEVARRQLIKDNPMLIEDIGKQRKKLDDELAGLLRKKNDIEKDPEVSRLNGQYNVTDNAYISENGKLERLEAKSQSGMSKNEAKKLAEEKVACNSKIVSISEEIEKIDKVRDKKRQELTTSIDKKIEDVKSRRKAVNDNYVSSFINLELDAEQMAFFENNIENIEGLFGLFAKCHGDDDKVAKIFSHYERKDDDFAKKVMSVRDSYNPLVVFNNYDVGTGAITKGVDSVTGGRKGDLKEHSEKFIKNAKRQYGIDVKPENRFDIPHNEGVVYAQDYVKKPLLAIGEDEGFFKFIREKVGAHFSSKRLLGGLGDVKRSITDIYQTIETNASNARS